MFQLRCSVRDCNLPLRQTDRTLGCDAGHRFDQAKQGHWNLLQPQDRKSLNPGDAEDAVLARHRWLQRGHAAGLVDALRPWCDASWCDGPGCDDQRLENLSVDSIRTLDLGCGEGSFGPLLFGEDPENYCGIDLSRKAIKLAVKCWPAATWVLANADRVLPVADASVSRIVSLFGRRPIKEIQRSLKPGGICIIAVPAEDDLIELRTEVQETGQRRNRWQRIVEQMTGVGIEFREHRVWRQSIELDRDSIADALAMTYRSGRYSRQSKLESMDAMRATVAADLLLFKAG